MHSFRGIISLSHYERPSAPPENNFILDKFFYPHSCVMTKLNFSKEFRHSIFSTINLMSEFISDIINTFKQINNMISPDGVICIRSKVKRGGDEREISFFEVNELV